MRGAAHGSVTRALALCPGALSESARQVPGNSSALRESRASSRESSREERMRNDCLGVSGGAHALSHAARAVSDRARAVSNGACALPNDALAVSDAAHALSNGAVAVSNGAVAVSNGALAVSNGALAVSNGALAVSNAANRRSRADQRRSAREEQLSRASAGQSGACEAHGTARETCLFSEERLGTGTEAQLGSGDLRGNAENERLVAFTVTERGSG